MGKQKNQYLPAEAGHPRGVLSGEDFRKILTSIFGNFGWRSAFERGTGYSRTQIYRFEKGKEPIPLRVGVIVQMLCLLRNAQIPFPETFDPSDESMTTMLSHVPEPDLRAVSDDFEVVVEAKAGGRGKKPTTLLMIEGNDPLAAVEAARRHLIEKQQSQKPKGSPALLEHKPPDEG